MTLEEKRDYLNNFCEEQTDCEGCVFDKDGTWCHTICKDPSNMIESELDTAIKLITHKDTINDCVNDPVNHPSHYTNGGMECIDEMILVFGEVTVAQFCLCNAWKYRYRAIFKNGEEDIQKSHWYMAKYKELVEAMVQNEEVH